MRPLLSLPLLLLVGCGYNWKLRDSIDTGQDLYTFYTDADGDGWGDPDGAYEVLPEADQARNLTARNNRDCDDDDAAITGRVASACPSQLVTPSAEIDARGVIFGEYEFLLVHRTTPTVWPTAAAAACGPWGWGGELAWFDDDAELAELYSETSDFMDFMGYIGAEPDGSGGWQWVHTGAGKALSTIPWCSAPVEAAVDGDRLTLVRQSDGWCKGSTADLALYNTEEHQAHFICKRPVPDPEPYAEPAVTTE